MLSKDDDEAGRGFRVGLVFVGSEWGQRVEPFLRRASTAEPTLLFFSSSPNPAFYLCITDDRFAISRGGNSLYVVSGRKFAADIQAS